MPGALALMAGKPELEVWAHEGCFDHPGFRKVFRFSLAAIREKIGGNSGGLGFKFKWLWHTIKANVAYYQDLKKHYDGTAQTWVANNSLINTAPALVCFGARHRKTLRIMIYFLNPASRSLKICGWLAKGLRAREVKIATEAENMAEAYREVMGIPCHVVPFPFPNRERFEEHFPQTKEPLKGLVLGAPRIEKGFELVVDAIEELKAYLENGSLELVFQSPPPVPEDGQRMMQAKKKLIALSTELPGITIIPKLLDEKEYPVWLYSSHFLILPYRLYAYSIRGSWIIGEACVAAKPIVVTQGMTFSADVLKGGSAIPMNDGDLKSLVKGIETMIAEFPGYAEKAEVNKASWKHQFAPTTFFEKLDALWEKE